MDSWWWDFVKHVLWWLVTGVAPHALRLMTDTHGIIDDELAEPFNTLIPLARHYNHEGPLPPAQPAPHTPADRPDNPTNHHDQTNHHTLVTSAHSSSKTTWVPPAGFEPALSPPEGGWCTVARPSPIWPAAASSPTAPTSTPSTTTCVGSSKTGSTRSRSTDEPSIVRAGLVASTVMNTSDVSRCSPGRWGGTRRW